MLIDGAPERGREAGDSGDLRRPNTAEEPGLSRNTAADAQFQRPRRTRPSAPRESSRARDEPTLAQFAWTVAERRWTVIGVTSAVLALMAAYLFVATPMYESSILVQVEDRTRPAAAFENVAPLFDEERASEGEIRIMKSRTLLDAVVGKLALDVAVRPRTFPVVGDALRRRHNGPAPAAAPLGLTRFAWGGERIRVAELKVSSALVDAPLVLTALDGTRYRVAAADGAVLVEGEVGTAATGVDGERTIELLVSELTARPGTEFILTQRHRVDVIESLRDSLHITDPGRNTGLVIIALQGEDPARVAQVLDAVSANYLRQTVERTSAQAAKMLQLLESQLPKLKANVDKADTAMAAFRRRNGTLNLPVEGESMLARLGEIDRALAEIELRRAELAQRYTEQHPDLAPLDERARRLQEQRSATEARMRALPDVELESTRLSRQSRLATELYLLVLNRAEELRIIKSGWLGDVRILETAVVPRRPVSPKPTFVLVLSILLGVALGVATALVRSALDEGLRDPDEIEAGTGLAVLATIPRSAAQRRIARRGRLAPLSVAEPGDAAIEDLRSLRTSVQFALQRSQNNVIVVGGLAPRAGKSFVSVNLAHVLAAAGARVLLVDGDLRRGVLHRYFGLDAQPGLADVVSGAADLEPAVRHTELPNLDLLPAGHPPSNPSELLAGAAFQRLLADVRRTYTAVIVDTPPIMSVTDSALVGRHAGINLLVLRAGDHSTEEIRFALRRLDQSGVTVGGAILNDLRGPHRRYCGARYWRYGTAMR